MCLSVCSLGKHFRDSKAKGHYITALIQTGALSWVLMNPPHQNDKQIEPTGKKQTVTFIFKWSPGNRSLLNSGDLSLTAIPHLFEQVCSCWAIEKCGRAWTFPSQCLLFQKCEWKRWRVRSEPFRNMEHVLSSLWDWEGDHNSKSASSNLQAFCNIPVLVLSLSFFINYPVTIFPRRLYFSINY